MKFFVTILLALVVFTLPAQDNLSRVDDLLLKKYQPDAPGAAVLIMKGGKAVFRKGYGLAQVESKQAVTPDWIFRIGSITKQFTATAILKLADEKKIDLQASITTYLPEFNTGGSTITVEQLLNHTSGIKSYTSLPGVMTGANKLKTTTVTDMLALIQQQPHDFAPGERYLYNNSGYFLLGAIIERVTGKPYDQYITQHFLKPLRMTSTYVNEKGLPATVATGYEATGEKTFQAAGAVDSSIPFAAGSLYATVDDLWKWNQAIFSGKVVKRSWLERAWSPTTLTGGQQVSYGYGWQLGRFFSSKVIGHGGAIDGYMSSELYVPDLDVYVCILQNSSVYNPEEIAYEILEVIADAASKKPQPVTIDPATLDAYTGVYAIPGGGERVIRRKGNSLYSQRTGGANYELYASGKDVFGFMQSRAVLQFVRDDAGRVIAADMSGQEWVTQRAMKTDKPIPAELVAIELDPATFDPYAGEYELAPGFIIKIWREEAVFKAQATGQPAFEIFPKSDHEFFLRVVEAQLVFNRDEQGTVVGLTLLQGGRQMPGKKIR